MAKLPVYGSDRSVGTGSEFMRPEQPSSDIAAGIVRLGNAVTSVGVVDARNADEEARRLRRQNERDDNVRLAATVLEYGSTIRDRALSDREGLSESGAGYTTGLETFANEERERLIRERFGHRTDLDYVRLQFNRVSEPRMNEAAAFEANRRQEWRAGTSTQRLDSLRVSLASDATPERYNQLVAEWDEFITTAIGGNARVQERYREIGRRTLARTALEAAAARDQGGFVTRVTEALANTPTDENRATNPMVSNILTRADASGVPREVLLAIGQLESRLNANAPRPTRRDGTVMSSAEGGWQITDEMARILGVRNRRDPVETTAAIADYVSQVRSRLQERGVEPTLGRTYMVYNMGQPLAYAVMRADPNARIEDVIRNVYAGNRGLAFAEQVIGNNPRMYRAGMTVGQVIANYERQTEGARSETAGFANGGQVNSEVSAQAIITRELGFEATGLTARDLGEVLVMARQGLSEGTARDRSRANGERVLNGEARADPYSQTDRNNVAAASTERGTHNGIASGDRDAFLAARRETDAAGHVPTNIMHAFRAAINGGRNNPGQVMAYQALSDLQSTNPGAYDASQIPEDERNRIREFQVATQLQGLSPAQAIERIEFRRSTEGRATIQAMRDQFGTGRNSELRRRTWSELAGAFDQAWTPMSGPNSTGFGGSDNWQQLALDTYHQHYQHWRQNGYSEDDARGRAILDMRDRWGVSNVMGGRGPSQVLMPFAPERVFGDGRRINGSFEWITQQARETIGSYIMSRSDLMARIRQDTGQQNPTYQMLFGRRDPTSGNYVDAAQGVGDVDFRLVPNQRTAEDVAAGREPTYRLFFRGPTGNIEEVPQGFAPHYEGALSRAEAEFRSGSAPRRRPHAPNPPDLLAPNESRTRSGVRVPN